MSSSPAQDLPRKRDSVPHPRGGVLFAVVVVVVLIALLGVEAGSHQSSPLVAGPWTSSVEGVDLQVTLNATTISVGQRLNITIVLLNTLKETDLIPTSTNWSFQAFPVAIWPPCIFVLPVEFVVLKGNYTLGDLEAAGSNSTADLVCMEGTTVDHVAFQPTSDIATMNGTYLGGEVEPTRIGPIRLATNFTVSGYSDFHHPGRGPGHLQPL